MRRNYEFVLFSETSICKLQKKEKYAKFKNFSKKF